MGAGRQHSVLPTILILNEADLSWTPVHFLLACVFKNNNYFFDPQFSALQIGGSHFLINLLRGLKSERMVLRTVISSFCSNFLPV